MTQWLEVKNWSEFQHYKHRSPPWIKLHFDLLSSHDWVSLPDNSKAILTVCMLIASRNDGRVPWDEQYLKRVGGLSRKPDLKPLIESGFLIIPQADDSTVQAPHKRMRTNALPEKSRVREEKSREEKKEVVASSATTDPVKEAVSDWNLLADKLNLPKVERLSPTRRKKWLANYGNGSADRWGRVLVAVGLSGFCQGENDRGWKADFDFVVTTSKIDKLLEGSYDGQKPESALRQAARNIVREINSNASDTSGGHSHSELSPQRVGVETEDVPGDFTVLGRGDLGDGN
tara:strand:- start:459 stop:1322 length:864 start_codon:yes stop_codon:yes gene_type:complete